MAPLTGPVCNSTKSPRRCCWPGVCIKHGVSLDLFNPQRDDDAGRGVSHLARTGHLPGTVGGKCRLLALDARHGHRRARLRCGTGQEHHQTDSADFILAYADWLAAHLEEWTVTTRGELVAGVPPALHPDQSHRCRMRRTRTPIPNTTMIQIANGGGLHPARNVVGGDFLHLVRFGIRSADDPIVRDSIEVIDRVIKRDLPQGPGLAPLQSRWLRAKGRRQRVRRHGRGPLLANFDRRTRPLRTGRRTRSQAVHRGDGKVRQPRRDDQRAALGRG